MRRVPWIALPLVVMAALLAGGEAVRLLMAPAAGSSGGWPGWPALLPWGLLTVAAVMLVVARQLGRVIHHARRSTPSTFLSSEERDRVVAAIAAFENRTSGEIRVHLDDRPAEDPLAAAAATFKALGMEHTAQRNGVLFYVSVRERRLAVVGDSGIDAATEEDFWTRLVRHMEGRFRERRFADGLVEGIDRAGQALCAHFPPDPNDVNELPDSISHGS
jgi:uncharacterized membrane protein